MEFDLLISGAGPAGLCLARALADTGLTIGLVEQQPEEALREAAFDGREIALTQRSASLMRELGLWKRIQDVDGASATIKVLSRKDGHQWLLPRNPDYAPIPGDEATIMGKVVTVLRSL